jgi:glycosyltransferase involved in cell wall biosynthesis
LNWNLMGLPYLRWQLTKVRAARSVSTVCRGIADRYQRDYAIDADVVMNASAYAELEPSVTRAPLRLIHSGGANPARKIELMIDAMRGIEGATLDLMLMSTGPGTVEALQAHAKDVPNVRFRDPVPFDELVPTLQQYDVGVFLLPPTNFNYEMALPNKLFEYVQARLAVVISPSPEMARIVREHDLGVVSEDFTSESFREAIRSLTAAKVEQFKANSHAAARALSAERATEPWAEAIEAIAGVERAATEA